MLASGEKIDFAVMLIGSNDRQPLRDANGSFESRSPEWQAAYTQRIETIAAMFRDKKIPLVWVGLPIMRSERLAEDAQAFNEFYRAYAEKAGATYIDIWEAFADEAGQVQCYWPRHQRSDRAVARRRRGPFHQGGGAQARPFCRTWDPPQSR